MAEILLSGMLNGTSSVSAAHLYALDEVLVGASQVSGSMTCVKLAYGHASGGSRLDLWWPENLEGYGSLLGTIKVTRSAFGAAHAPKCFRYGHVFGPGDLEFILGASPGTRVGASCVVFTLYRMKTGCVPQQIGPKDRAPVTRCPGTYYATGTAGECGQPGLWFVRWCYRRTFGSTPQHEDFYFYVLDSVLCPVPGDTLPRVIKWGWQ
jgi:hypothetical protein